jgi:predicted protein tyrosine phosphatase
MAIIVCPLSRAPALARDKKPSHVVSLLDPGTPFPELEGYGAESHFRLAVHDIEDTFEGLDAVDDRRIGEIIDFVSRWPREAPILIHCYAGISRSTATAFITACVQNPSADEEEIAQHLRTASHIANPNRRFVALADAALGRNGRMSRAIETIGRGATWLDVGESHPFELPARFA